MKNRVPKLFCCAVPAAFALLSETGICAPIGGVPLWTNYYSAQLGVAAGPLDLAADTSGNVFVTGYAAGDFATVKYSGAGVPLWTNRFNGPANSNDGGRAVAVDSNGNAFVTGSSGGNGSATIKYSATGVPLWTNYVDAFTTQGIVVDQKSGKVIVAGTTADFVSPAGDYITAAYSTTGAPLWTNYYNGPENLNDHIRGVAVDGSGNVVVTGYSAGTFATIKYSATGVPLWTNRYGSFPNAVGVDSNGNIFVTGYADGCATIKYSGAGVALWTNVYPGDPPPSAGFAQGEALALDNSGNLYVAGSTFNSTTGSNDFLTLKYSGAGVPLWTNRYNGPENMYDAARSIGVDGSGNVFVLGDSSYNSSGDAYFVSFTTLAYSSGGVPLWTNRFTSASGMSFEASDAIALAVDGNGNVFVVGQTGVPPSFDRGYVTIKYSSVLPPRLTINRTATNTVVVSWPSPSTGFTLQQNADVNHSVNWSNVSAGVQDDGTTKTLVVNPASGTRFYRLNKP